MFPKFKVWSKKDKNFVDSQKVNVALLPGGQNIAVIDNHGNLTCCLDQQTHSVVFSTGCKDKNGQEIFNHNMLKDEGGAVDVVYWNQHHAQFLVNFADLEDQEIGDWAQVIGIDFRAAIK